ncbi:MAG: invasion associated locus B family protein [Pseudomonadota bacterium]
MAVAPLLLAFATVDIAQAATRINSYRDWSLFSHEEPQRKICFVASQPKEMEPAAAKRDAVFFYISSWPKDGVKSEISVRMGYPIKPGSTVKITVGGKRFELFAKDDNAFVANPQDELRLISAMKAGSLMKVGATSARGTATTDNYSLMGISAALKGLATTCR